MSSPNHLTSGIEDAFSSNFPDFIPASPDYVMQAYDVISPPQVTIPSPTVVPPSPVLSLSPMFDSRYFFPPKKISPPKDAETSIESPIPISPSLSVGSSSPVRTSTSAAPAMTQTAMKKLVADSVSATLEAQAAIMVNADKYHRTQRKREAPNCIEDCKVKFATGTLTEEALSWWNSFASPTGIEEAYKITWVEFKKLLIKKYCPRTEELATLYPTMVPNTEKHMEAFIGGLPRSIKGNVTTSKPQTLEEAINITQRLMDQVTRHNYMQ
ncbi:hypothetical protein Tco_0013781 [Tanacetum coccineum]